MTKFKIDNEIENDQTVGTETVHNQSSADECGDNDEFTNKAVTVGVVAVGVALFEVALVPAVLVGAAAALAPNYLPEIRERLEPMFSSTIRGAYKLVRKARSTVGEMQEHVNDLAAEVHAEEVAKSNVANAAATTAEAKH